MIEMADKELKVSKVPNLRFPQFTGVWEVKKLGEIATFSKGKGISKNDIDESGITECIRYGELYTHYREIINDVKSKTNVDISTLILSEENDVIIPASGETTIDIATASCVLKSGIALGSDLNIIKTKNNGIFLSYYLNSKKKIEIANLAQGISVVHLYSSQLASLSLSLPKLNEQNRISSFLALLDERIQTQNKIIEELKTLKKALLKKIFTQELSFSVSDNGCNKTWPPKKMKELFSFKLTNSLSRDKLNYEEGAVKNVHYGDIHTKFHNLFDLKRENVPYINSIIDLSTLLETNYCKTGDMIFADASEDLKDVGKSIEIINLDNQKMLSGLHTILARPIDNVFSTGFCGYLFSSEPIRQQIQKESQGTKVLSISANRLSSIILPVPTLYEQVKIVNLLSSVDSKLDIMTAQLQKFKEQKMFLLSQMFV